MSLLELVGEGSVMSPVFPSIWLYALLFFYIENSSTYGLKVNAKMKDTFLNVNDRFIKANTIKMSKQPSRLCADESDQR